MHQGLSSFWSRRVPLERRADTLQKAELLKSPQQYGNCGEADQEGFRAESVNGKDGELEWAISWATLATDLEIDCYKAALMATWLLSDRYGSGSEESEQGT